MKIVSQHNFSIPFVEDEFYKANARNPMVLYHLMNKYIFHHKNYNEWSEKWSNNNSNSIFEFLKTNKTIFEFYLELLKI